MRMTTRELRRDGRPDSRVEPHRSTTDLTRIPDSHDLLRIGDGLAFGLETLGLGSDFGGCALRSRARRFGPIAGEGGPRRAAIVRLINVSNA
jgi:hypothetical protein